MFFRNILYVDTFTSEFNCIAAARHAAEVMVKQGGAPSRELISGGAVVERSGSRRRLVLMLAASQHLGGVAGSKPNTPPTVAEGSLKNLHPLPLQRSPEFGPGTDFDALISEVLTRGAKEARHCGQTSLTSTSFYMEDIGHGFARRLDDVMDALEARDVGQEHGEPWLQPKAARSGSQSLEF